MKHDSKTFNIIEEGNRGPSLYSKSRQDYRDQELKHNTWKNQKIWLVIFLCLAFGLIDKATESPEEANGTVAFFKARFLNFFQEKMPQANEVFNRPDE